MKRYEPYWGNYVLNFKKTADVCKFMANLLQSWMVHFFDTFHTPGNTQT